MSKKKSLSPTASLATCLDFAARVLSSTASVQEICTKPVLAPMVVEAHRYGQQAAKHLESGAPADVRKLLKVLQSSSLSRGTPLARLDVADLTWDFEGTVADTLEMELEELEDRAATNVTDICVVFSALTPVSGGGHAVIWFPKQNRDDHRDEDDDTRTVVTKHQVLLYVCPGRVKIVKNVGDLVKKLYDELPSLRESGALYNVWAVLKGDSPACNQQDHHASSPRLVESKIRLDNQFEAERFGGDPKSPAETSVVAKLETKTLPTSAKLSMESKKSTSDQGDLDARGRLNENMNNRVDNSASDQLLEVVTQPQQEATIEPEELPLVSSRFPIYQDVTSFEQHPAGSIFSFGMDKKVSIFLPLTPSQHLLDDLEVNENCDENTSPDVGDAESVVNCTSDNQVQASWNRGNVISSSVPDFSTKRCMKDKDVEQGLGVRLKQGLAWQSCDGKVLRRSVRPQPSMAATNEGEDCSEVDVPNNQDNKEDSAKDYRTEEVEAIATIDEVSQSSEVRASQLETNEEFSRSPSLGDDTISIFRFGYPQEGNEHPESESNLLQQVTTFAEIPADAQIADDFPAPGLGESGIRQTDFEDDVSPVEPNNEIESPGCPELSIQTQEIAPPPKPAVNYKDKLGARVWWELAYTARKLEREEMIERRQRIRGDTRTTPSRKASRQNFGVHPTGPQRLEPTGWSKQLRPEKQNEVSVSPDESTGDVPSQSSSDVAVSFAHELIEKAADIDTQIANPTTLSQSLQGDNKRNLEQPYEALSPVLIQKNARSSQDNFSLNKETTSIKQLAEISASIKSLEVTQNQPVQEDRELECGTLEPSTWPPSETLLLPRTIRSSMDVDLHSKEMEKINPLPVMTSRTVGISTSKVTHQLPKQDDEELTHGSVSKSSTLLASSPHVLVSLSKEYEASSNKLNENRQSLKNSEPSKSPTYSLRTRSSIGLKISDSTVQDEDETVAQLMWASTRTSYEKDHTADFQQIGKESPQEMEISPVLPFTVRGRVPIRTHRDLSKVVVPAEGAAHVSPSSSKLSESTIILSNEDDKPSRHVKPSSLPRDAPEVQPTPRILTPTPVATFIPLGDDTPRSPSAPVASRQERLNELRQKKLRKLQQTRDLSLQQHKEKQHQRQMHRPLSFASSVYSKKASNRQLMQNALEFTLLAGGSMEKERMLALQALAESPCDNFIVLLKSAKELKFRALYENHVERDSATRIYSVLPSNSSRAPLKLGSSEMISQFFKYSSAKKQFLPVPTRSFTVKTDACALVDQLVFKGKAKSSAIARLL